MTDKNTIYHIVKRRRRHGDNCRNGLKTLQLSYNLPKPWVNKVHLKNAAVYVMGTNLFTLSRFKLWDPELNTDNGASYPNTTSYSVGINFTF